MIEYFAQKSLNFDGKLTDQRIVRFGSGDGPIFDNVWINLNEVLDTSVLPSRLIPAIDSVAQTGSPEKISLYAGVLVNFTILNFITK